MSQSNPDGKQTEPLTQSPSPWANEEREQEEMVIPGVFQKIMS